MSSRQEKLVGQPEVQFRRPGQSVDVIVRTVVQRRMGEHHVHGAGRGGSGSTGKRAENIRSRGLSRSTANGNRG